MERYTEGDTVRLTKTNEWAVVRASYGLPNEPQMLDLAFIDKTFARIPASDVEPFHAGGTK